MTIATVTDHSLAKRRAQQPLVKLFTVGFSWLGRAAIGPKGVLPAAQIRLEDVADALPYVLDLRYWYIAIVFSLVRDRKCLFEVVLFRVGDDLMNCANPVGLHIFGS